MKNVMETLGVSTEASPKGKGGRWRGARFDTNSDQGKKDWDEILKGLGIPTNKGHTYENSKFKEVVLGLASALSDGTVTIVKK